MHCISPTVRYEFRYQGPISLKFTSLPYSRTEFNSTSLNSILLTNYFDITKLKQEPRNLTINWKWKNYENKLGSCRCYYGSGVCRGKAELI